MSRSQALEFELRHGQIQQGDGGRAPEKVSAATIDAAIVAEAPRASPILAALDRRVRPRNVRGGRAAVAVTPLPSPGSSGLHDIAIHPRQRYLPNAAGTDRVAPPRTEAGAHRGGRKPQP